MININIVDVVPDSPAAKAGLQAGDVIEKIGDKKITKADEVQQAVAKTEVGDTLALDLQRDNEQVEIEVRVGILPQPQQYSR